LLAGTSTEDATRNSSQANEYYQQTGRHDPGRPRRRWLNGLMFEDGMG
jgi:hypothetical protein